MFSKLMLLLVFMFIVVQANANIYKNAPTGFKGVEWGDSVGKAPKAGFTDKKGDRVVLVYLDKKVGDIKIASMSYTFFKNSMDTVNITIDYRAGCVDMVGVLVSVYGVTWTQPNPYIERFMWFNNFKGDITTVFVYDDITNSCSIRIANALINKKAKKAVDLEKINKAKGDM